MPESSRASSHTPPVKNLCLAHPRKRRADQKSAQRQECRIDRKRHRHLVLDERMDTLTPLNPGLPRQEMRSQTPNVPACSRRRAITCMNTLPFVSQNPMMPSDGLPECLAPVQHAALGSRSYRIGPYRAQCSRAERRRRIREQTSAASSRTTRSIAYLSQATQISMKCKTLGGKASSISTACSPSTMALYRQTSTWTSS